MKWILVGASLVTLTMPLEARTTSVTCFGGSCIVTSGPTVDRTVQQMPPMTPEQEERDKRWQEFCRPTPHLDRHGMTRFTYAHEGCEYGRTE